MSRLDLAGLARLRWLLGLPWSHPITAVFAFGLGLVGLTFSTWLPLVLGDVVNGLAERRPDALTSGAVTLFAVGVGQFACAGVRRAAGGRLGADVTYDLRQRLARHLLDLDRTWFEGTRTGELLSRANSDIATVSAYLSFGLALSLSSLLTAVVAATRLALLAPGLALIAVGLCPLLAVFTWRYDTQGNRLSRRVQRRIGDLTTVIEESAAGIKVIKAFGIEQRRREVLAENAELLMAENLRVARLRARFAPILSLLPQVGLVGMLWYGGTQVAHGDISLGTLVAADGYMAMIATSLAGFSSLSGLRQRALAGAERVKEILDTRPLIADPPGAIALPSRAVGRHAARLTLDGVTVRYPGAAQPVLRRVDLDLAPGEWVALTGESGSGKSTLAALFCRGTDPSEGRVLIDGHDIGTVTLESLRAQVVVLPTEPVIFVGTLRSNVAFGRPESTEDEVRHALWVAAALDFAEDTPDGLEASVGERGQTLSGGQRQRLAVARAVLARPRILVLDDALSQLDPVTEHRVLDRLAVALPDTTVVMIGRPRADLHLFGRCLVLDNGRVSAVSDREPDGVFAAPRVGLETLT